jgi:hypothetical protein
MWVATLREQPNLNGRQRPRGRGIGTIYVTDTLPGAAGGHNWLGQEKKLEQDYKFNNNQKHSRSETYVFTSTSRSSPGNLSFLDDSHAK